ncbi:MAG: peptidoglycan glycosyltransferase [Lachnospiraceae bacterium]|nr:peptidoglycan glycosyltransferase [Lachnospiraceae bacterium]
MLVMIVLLFAVAMFLVGRLGYIMIGQGEYYSQKANDLHERERAIKAPRGRIIDRNGVVLAGNRSVCTISVIHSQLTDPEEVIRVLCEHLGLSEDTVRTKVEKISSREKIASNVDMEVADRIREYHLDGVMIDDDYRRYYPYDTLASKVLGFTGADNQGIVGLEVKYDSVLQGTEGYILTLTDAHGIEIDHAAEHRKEPVEGNDLHISLDANIQKYAEQEASKALIAKEAIGVSIIVMNPNNGEIYAMVNEPEYSLNDPYTLIDPTIVTSDEALNNAESSGESAEIDTTEPAVTKQDALNMMWRNFCVNDTYEPGSIFKTVTATAAFEHGTVRVDDVFQCPGYRIIGNWTIKCHKRTGHGTETFREGIMNSCNPVFMDVGLRTGSDAVYETYEKLGLLGKTGIDLPGEAGSILHPKDEVQDVDLAVMSFGQSLQFTPIQILTAVSTIVNGGNKITPHFGTYVTDTEGNVVDTFEYPVTEHVISEETSRTMRELMEAVVMEGGGSKGQVEGYRIAGKTATSEKLPRGNGKYISSYIGAVPAENPQVITLVLINEPTGIYYGGTIAAPISARIYENILPYLGLYPTYEGEE